MEKKSILKELKSFYIIEIIFSYIKDKDYKYIIAIYSKAIQNKLNISLFDYQKKYINKKGIIINSYLSNKDYNKFEKDYLIKKLNEDLLKFNINKDSLENYLDYFFKNYRGNNYFIIDIFSPFFEFLLTKKYFKTLFTIQVNLIEENLENDYISVFKKLNQSEFIYSSLDFIVNKNISKDKWKNYKINFNYFKYLIILKG